MFPAQPSGKGASTVRLGILSEATSPVAWRTEHDESFGLPHSQSRFATVATTVVTPTVSGSQAGELMDRINHVNRLLAEVEHIYPETATTTAVAATSATMDVTGPTGRTNMVTAHEVSEVAQGVLIEESASTTESNDEKELLNLTQFVTDEIASVVDNALAAVNAAYSAPTKGTFITFIHLIHYSYNSYNHFIFLLSFY